MLYLVEVLGYDMRCFNPIKIRDPVTGIMRQVSCYYCEACIMRRKAGWFLRLKNEEKRSKSVWFITVTYADEYLTFGLEGATLVKADLQKFTKRLRKSLYGSKSKGKYFKYYAVGEYGTLEKRPHYHMLLFLDKMEQKQLSDTIEKSWKLGRSQVEPAGLGSFQYVSGYIQKSEDHYDKAKYELLGINRAFALMSKGLGEEYIQKKQQWHRDDITRGYAVIENGIKVPLPRYYRDRLYSKEERQEQTNVLIQNSINELNYTDSVTISERQRLKADRRESFRRLIKNNSKTKL